MSKYFTKSQTNAINELVNTLLENVKKSGYKKIKKSNDNANFFNNMGINDLSKPMKSNYVKKSFGATNWKNYQPFSSNTNNLNNSNNNFGNSSSGTYSKNPFNNQFGGNTKNTNPYNQNTSNTNSNQFSNSNPFNNTTSFTQPEQPYSSENTYNLNQQDQYSTNVQQPQTTSQYYGQGSYDIQSRPYVQQQPSQNTTVSKPLVQSTYTRSGLTATAGKDIYNRKMNAFAYKPKLSKVVLLDDTGKVIDPTKYSASQRNLAARLQTQRSKNPNSPLIFVNSKNQVVPNQNLTPQLKALLNTEIKTQTQAQKTAYDNAKAALERDQAKKASRFDARIKAAIASGVIPQNLAQYMTPYQNEYTFSNQSNSSTATSQPTETFRDFMNRNSVR